LCNHAQGANGAGCGGLAILLASKWANTVASSGSCYNGRALWVILKDIPGGELGILNIYGPNDQNDMKLLWQEISLVLSRHCRWILGGDFNMVETQANKSSICGRLIGNQEKLAWEGLKSDLNIADPFQRQRGLKFSWDNGRTNGERVLARLDRFYIFSIPAIGTSRSIISYTILGDSTLSDHHPVAVQLKFGETSTAKTHWKMNVRYLDEAKEEIAKIWQSLPSSRFSFFAKIRQAIRFYKRFCAQKATDFRAQEVELRRDLALAQSLLLGDPFSGHLQLRAATLKDRLATLEKQKTEGIRIRSRVKWKDKGDWGSGEFFKLVSEKSKSTLITKLRDRHGSLVTNGPDLEDTCWQYYCSLYEKPVVTHTE
jgi:hypothetical protein